MSIKVYRASAGSGKTYTLVYEYIRYLFGTQFGEIQDTRHETRNVESQQSTVINPLGLRPLPLRQGENMRGVQFLGLNLHRRVLAVTFTNKSTAVMK